ncbi:CCHC-type domain-containing protein [Nephila pilipes]|uniref:CCHC-type domain-containing protein n=1 Tax=Nephila pilipes TaxID=299642 RepID=A0A8X6U3B5_NEPPI|nr:CCHC-type domain-containing protein [Nephila pilipes]
MAFLIRRWKINEIQLARDLDESPDPSMSKIVLRDLIISSKYYTEEEAKELLEVITAEKWEISPCAVGFWCEITVVKKDLVPGISVQGASTIYLKSIFVPLVKCPLVYNRIGLQVNVVRQQVLCALAEVLMEDVLLPPDVLDMLGGARSEENSLVLSSQYLGGDSGALGETEVSSGILQEKIPENVEDSQNNITSCWNEVGTMITKDKEITAETDKGVMVADSFRSEQDCGAELA